MVRQGWIGSLGLADAKYYIYLLTFGCAGSLLLHWLSLVAASRGLCPVVMHGLLIVVSSLVEEHRLISTCQPVDQHLSAA